MKEINNSKLIKVENAPKVEKIDTSLENIFQHCPEVLKILKQNKASTFHIYTNFETEKFSDTKPILAVRIPHNLLLPTSENGVELPIGYAYIGGTFRSGLLHLLGVKGIQPRDLDVASLAKNSLNEENLISEEFMPDDFQFGNGVKQINAFQQLSQQDFTINSGFISSKFIIATPECIQDIYNGIIYPTKFGVEHHSFSRLASRALKFYITFKEIYNKAEIKGMPDNIWESIDLWDIGLIMQKSLEHGLDFAIEMYDCLCKYNLVGNKTLIAMLKPSHQHDVLFKFLFEIEEETSFKFRGKVLELFPTLKLEHTSLNPYQTEHYGDWSFLDKEIEDLDEADEWDDVEEQFRNKK